MRKKSREPDFEALEPLGLLAPGQVRTQTLMHNKVMQSQESAPEWETLHLDTVLRRIIQ